MQYTTAEALQNSKLNKVRRWHSGASSGVTGTNPADAGNRIFDTYADVRPTYHGPLFDADTPVFAMGSCFARELEHALRRRGGNIVSIDETIQIPEFEDTNQQVRTGFFHRFTPSAMAQEFRWPFGRQEGWTEDSLLFDESDDTLLDLNYTAIAAKNDHGSVRLRRQIAGTLVRNLVDARIIIVTLGLTEGWIHLPTGLAVNAMSPKLLKRSPTEFALEYIGFSETTASLESILELIEAEHVDGEFQVFVTVSPVPLGTTFSREDIIEANMTSKSTLRAAAAAFAKAHEKVNYFPSYELVNYTNPALAWRPDKLHVDPAMVKHIMNRFVETVYKPGAFK